MDNTTEENISYLDMAAGMINGTSAQLNQEDFNNMSFLYDLLKYELTQRSSLINSYSQQPTSSTDSTSSLSSSSNSLTTQMPRPTTDVPEKVLTALLKANLTQNQTKDPDQRSSLPLPPSSSTENGNNSQAQLTPSITGLEDSLHAEIDNLIISGHAANTSDSADHQSPTNLTSHSSSQTGISAAMTTLPPPPPTTKTGNDSQTRSTPSATGSNSHHTAVRNSIINTGLTAVNAQAQTPDHQSPTNLRSPASSQTGNPAATMILPPPPSFLPPPPAPGTVNHSQTQSTSSTTGSNPTAAMTLPPPPTQNQIRGSDPTSSNQSAK